MYIPVHVKTQDTIVKELRESILSILNNKPSPSAEKFLLSSAHTLAANILRIKFMQTPSIKYHLGLNEHDLGYDCIAELFERDTANQLIHFKTYFSNFDFASLTEKEILLHFRRLIFSATNQNLMHIYRDFDPSLGKIIRNIKIAIAAHKTFVEVDRFDEVCIAPIHCDLSEHLASADQTAIFEMLSGHVRGNEFVPELLSIFSRCIREQEEYSKVVPLISVALTFRPLLAAKQEHLSFITTNSVNIFETTEIVQKVTEQIKSTVLLRNNGKEKIKPDTVEAYFKTIHNVLLAKMNETNGSADSLFEGLKEHLKHLTVSEYRKCHRTKLEYYYKLCREAIAAELLNLSKPFK